MSILGQFYGTPRPAQVKILTQLEKHWAANDVFVIQAPVSVGKSRCAVALAKWLARRGATSAILTSNNILTDQYAADFPEMPTLYGRAHYDDVNDARQAREMALAAHSMITNYWCYQSHRMSRDCVIIDEAHNVMPMLASGAAITLPRSQYGWPGSIETTADLLEWLEQLAPVERTQALAVGGMRDVIRTRGASHVISRHKTATDEMITLQPLDARHIDHKLFSPYSKVVLMSATINEHDIYDLGLDQRRVVYLQCDSVIPAVNRPAYVWGKHRMTWGNDKAVAALADEIREILTARADSGIVHCTYSMAAELRKHLGTEERIIWHTNRDKKYQFGRFCATPGSVLVASGMYEGIDLAHDVARWQAICKVPFPSLGEPAVREKLRLRPESYAWAAIRDVLQAYGRVCRAPDDYGATYILDASWRQLAQTHRKLLPDWFRSAVVG